MVSRTLTSIDGIRVRSCPQISISGLGNDQKSTIQLSKHNNQDSSWLAFESPWISHQYTYSKMEPWFLPKIMETYVSAQQSGPFLQHMSSPAHVGVLAGKDCREINGTVISMSLYIPSRNSSAGNGNQASPRGVKQTAQFHWLCRDSGIQWFNHQTINIDAEPEA